MEIVLATVAGLGSLLAGGVVFSDVIQKFVGHLLVIQTEPKKPYAERLSELSSSLTKASREVDSVLGELAEVAQSREAAVQKLETDIETLETREKALKEKIETLASTPLPVAEHFAKLLESGARRGAKRDYVLFGAGVIVTTVIAILIQVVAG